TVVVTELTEATAWDAFVATSDPGSYLQRTAWARVKAVNGWSAHRVAADPAGAAERGCNAEAGRIGAQVLVRRPSPMPWGSASAPRGRVADAWPPGTLEAFTAVLRSGLREPAGRVSHVRIAPEIEAGGPLDPDGSLRRALRAADWRPAPAI